MRIVVSDYGENVCSRFVQPKQQEFFFVRCLRQLYNATSRGRCRKGGQRSDPSIPILNQPKERARLVGEMFVDQNACSYIRSQTAFAQM